MKPHYQPANEYNTMKAMILAAGRGERLRPLTDTTPKPLLKIAGKMLIEYHLINLATAGFKDIIINTAWLAKKIHQVLGDGSQYGVNIHYSDETEALETAGGIIHALPLLGKEPFLVVNGDIFTDFDFASLKPLDATIQAQLILVPNPEHHQQGDFAINHGLLSNQSENRYTYSGIGSYSPRFFSGYKVEKLALAPLLRNKAENRCVSAQLYNGKWTDIGTIERLLSSGNP